MVNKIYENEKNYTAVVVKISNLKKLEGLDNLQATSIFGNQILVDNNTKTGDFGLYFPAECQLSDEFCSLNNLYRHTDKNNDPNAKAGFVEDNRRIKAIRLRGHQSAGFWIPIDSINYITKGHELEEGLEFNELDGVEVCRKYISGRNKVRSATSGKKKEIRLVDLVDTRCFSEHYDTSHLFRNFNRLSLDDTVSVTVKVHGTSLRVSNTIVYRQLNWFQKFLRDWFKVPIDEKTYRYVVGSRRVIKSVDYNGLDGKQHYYGSADLYTEAARVFRDKLHKNERIYAEIIGWVDNQKPIQKGYTYSLPQGTHKVYVYRISNVNDDGVAQDLPWNMLKQRCEELGVDYVPEIYYGDLGGFEGLLGSYILSEIAEKINTDSLYEKVKDATGSFNSKASWKDNLEEIIKTKYLEKDSIFSSAAWKNVEEGIVLTKEKLGVFEAFKAKSFQFLAHETKMKDSGETDIEDVQDGVLVEDSEGAE